MNLLEGDSEVKLHLPLLSISGWKSNGKPTKIQHHPHNHQNQASISKSSRFRIILKIHSASAYPSKSQQSSTILKTIKIEASSFKSIKIQHQNFKSTLVKVPGIRVFHGLVISKNPLWEPRKPAAGCRLLEKPKCPFFGGKGKNSSWFCWSLPITFVSNGTNLGPRELHIYIYMHTSN